MRPGNGARRSVGDSDRPSVLRRRTDAPGGVWGWRIAANPFGTLNLAGDHLTAWQIRDQVAAALSHKPKTVYLTAGRFDVESPDYNEDRTIETLREIIEMTHDQAAHVVLTLAPYGTNPEKNEKLAALNKRIEEELDAATILNINNTVAPQGTLLNLYTTDGTHLNEAAYDVWAGMVKSTMAGGDAFRPTATPGVKRR